MTGISDNPRIRIRWVTSIAVAVLLMPGVPLAAKQKKGTHVTHRRSRHSKATHRYEQVQIQPERVREIQAALAKAGVYHDEPSGQWDTATKDAMREFQKQNGFSPTGLPESKPLLLLGLGPHSLPPGLGPVSAAEPGGEPGSHRSAAEAGETADSPAAGEPPSSK